MSDEAAEAQRQRPFRVGLLALGVDHLGRVPEQRDLAPHQRQPGARPRRDEGQRLVGPVARDFSGREPFPLRAFRELGGVLPFVLRCAAAEAQRLVGAVGAGIVADVEVGSELRRRDVEAAADIAVPRGHRNEHDREPRQEQRSRARAASPQPQPPAPSMTIHARMTRMKTSAFSRVSARPPIVRPRATPDVTAEPLNRREAFLCAFCDLCGFCVDRRDINHSARQTKKTSRTDFCSRPSKKIAGA